MTHIARDDAITLLKKYNQDPFHIQHALTVEAVMKWYAKELGYGDDAEYWGIVGLLHDIAHTDTGSRSDVERRSMWNRCMRWKKYYLQRMS